MSDCFCILLRDAARKVTAAYDAALAPAGINLAQFRLLRHIAEAGPVSLTDLGKRVDLDRSTVGRNVRLLERRKLVRLAHGKDQREAVAELDPTGEDTLQQAFPLWSAAQAAFESGLGADKARELRAALRAL